MSVDANGSRIEFEDESDDDFAYEEVDVDIDDDDLEEGEDLETALIKVRQQQQIGVYLDTLNHSHRPPAFPTNPPAPIISAHSSEGSEGCIAPCALQQVVQ